MKTIVLFSIDYGVGYVWNVAFRLYHDFQVQTGEHFADMHPFSGWNALGNTTCTLKDGVDYLTEAFPADPNPYFVTADRISVFYNGGETVRVIQGGILLHQRHSTVCGESVMYIDVIFFLIQYLASQFNSCAYVKYMEEGIEIPEAFAPVRGWRRCNDPVFAALYN
jgi:hypothetical protein